MTQSLLDTLPVLSHIRRNHGLEHATMSVLAGNFQGLVMAGMSGPTGFVLFADLPTETITDATLEALERLQEGEHELAVHPNCGTNLVASSVFSALAAWIVMAGTGKDARLKLWRLPLALVVAVPVFFLSKPLGPWLQRLLTTSAIPGGMQVGQVTTQKINGKSVHHIITRF